MGHYLGGRGYTLRSLGLTEADQALIQGAGAAPVVIWSPFARRAAAGTQPLTLALFGQVVAHPLWADLRHWLARDDGVQLDTLSPITQRLYACTLLAVLGPSLDAPGERLICWTPEGAMVGLVKIAWMIAASVGVDVHNLAKASTYLQWSAFLQQHAASPVSPRS